MDLHCMYVYGLFARLLLPRSTRCEGHLLDKNHLALDTIRPLVMCLCMRAEMT